MPTMINAFAIFHLNLAYSSVPISERKTVIERCYHPLLNLIESQAIKAGVELSGWTLQQISELSPEWVERFRRLLIEGQCELIGSGHSQIIGPLAPYKVNVWNQRLGLEDYQKYLALTPSLALINEMAYSSGILDFYHNAGYTGLIMDGDNISLALGMGEKVIAMPNYADSGNGTVMPVLWSDSILFQKLQRYAHGEIGMADYMSYVSHRASTANGPLAIYCNDAEVFDYRPGRYKVESTIQQGGEWQRIADLLNELKNKQQVSWLTPSQALQFQLKVGNTEPQKLNSARQPIPVKKQAKYNISRWAVSGRNDLWLNTLCHRIFNALSNNDGDIGNDTDSNREGCKKKWQRLCECYASDLRTHITEERWQRAIEEINELAIVAGVSTHYGEKYNEQTSPVKLNLENTPECDEEKIRKLGFTLTFDAEGIYLTVHSRQVRLVLNLRRGLAIHSVSFLSHDFVPVVGTLPHGYFDSIELGADFYTGTTVIELATEHRRITDLEVVKPHILLENNVLMVRAEITTDLGIIVKEVAISPDAETVSMATVFPDWQRPYGTIRVSSLTLLPEAFDGPLTVWVNNGGKTEEFLTLSETCQHHFPSSTLVSCKTGLCGVGGELRLGDTKKGVKLTWDPSECAGFAMLHYQQCPPAFLNRILFSLSELDETFRPGGSIPRFQYHLSPATGHFKV